ncbi:Clavaminate synthase-like protein [Aureobasidium melanogenum CBS 110374]|uniref:Clavaminate synthase-like protein n=1 Tax=Aureobasidium melanogenum (strain CBS 110374) TaxID=1043003 RepID=A0A074VYJ6_AURM1|nr:Clavaminate synthase-like protein [Aureobasidium melanogenum CBS 110374]KEQ65588.1 Clavaminate synthase-like protein [Aureobasidium melanogenum CBS 110374]
MTDGKIPQWKLGQPKDFYSNFVHKRQPVVIQGKLEDLDFVTKNWSNVDYLRETAGDASVKVEPMHKEKKRYGTDVERVDTTFGAFLDSLREEKEEYDYLTTQYSDDEDDMDSEDDDEDNEEKEDGQDNEIKNGTFPQPVRALLRDEVPMRPEMMGNLVLQQMNIWLGKTKAGTSSGLHHDFHDNLYILLKGRKRFVLYPPSAVYHLDTYGKPKKIHPNGLINEADEIRADGLVERDAAALKVQALEEQMDKLEESGEKKGLDKVQKEYGDAVERLMKYQAADFGELGEDDFDEVSSEEESDPEDLKDQVLRDAPNKKRKAEEDLSGSKPSKTAKAGAEDDEDSDANDDDSDAELLEALERAQNGQRDDFDDDEDVSDLEEAFANAQGEDSAFPTEPLSFSQVSTQDLHSHLGLTSTQKTSAALEKAGKPYIVELKAGDMLYLPTSWFHEVTSFSDEKSEDNVHIALNYWFHPPDAQKPEFEKPYADATLWKFMEEKVKGAYEGLIADKED